MNALKKYTLAYSPCPNDTFIFKAIAKHLIALDDYRFDISLEDVETLNQQAQNGLYDITKLSFAALGFLLDDYALLRTGSALGMGCGPLIISNPGRSLSDTKQPVVAVPGMGTTAYHLFRFYLDDLYPGLTPRIQAMPFEKIMPAVKNQQADFGVIIHEGRFVYDTLGLEMKADLGQWWESATSMPIPLGCIAVKRSLGAAAAGDIEALIHKSIEHAFRHPEAERDYIREHAQELEESVIDQHIELYVNDFSKHIGSKGEQAITAFFDKARQSGLIKPAEKPLFAC